MGYRSANSLSVVKSSQRARARSHIPKLPRSNVSLLLSVSSTSVTESHSSVARPRLKRMRLYVFHDSQRSCTFESLTIFFVQNEYAQILAKRVTEEKSKRVELRKRRASSMKK